MESLQKKIQIKHICESHRQKTNTFLIETFSYFHVISLVFLLKICSTLCARFDFIPIILLFCLYFNPFFKITVDTQDNQFGNVPQVFSF